MIRQQRENDRREREAARIERLPQDEQQTASAAETAKRNSYQHQPSEPPSVIGKFVCSHPDCTKPPFQTQYLLEYVILDIQLTSAKKSVLTQRPTQKMGYTSAQS